MKKKLYGFLIVIIVLFFVGCNIKNKKIDNDELVCNFNNDYSEIDTEYILSFDKNGKITKIVLKEIIPFDENDDFTRDIVLESWEKEYSDIKYKGMDISYDKYGTKDLIIIHTFDLSTNNDVYSYRLLKIDESFNREDYKKILTESNYTCGK